MPRSTLALCFLPGCFHQITLAETIPTPSSSSSSASSAASIAQASLSTTQDNFEPLGPIIKQLHEQGLEDIFLRSLDRFVEDKEREIEHICGENYEVSDLFLSLSYTDSGGYHTGSQVCRVEEDRQIPSAKDGLQSRRNESYIFSPLSITFFSDLHHLQDFVSSVSTLLTVRQGTVHLRHRIGELDSQMGEVGKSLMDKVRAMKPRHAATSRVLQITVGLS